MKISFETKLFKIKDWTILRLPVDASAKLPSRGMVMVEGTINDNAFKTVLEPDGNYSAAQKPSHWFRVDEKMLKTIHANAGDTVKLEIESTDEWIPPEVPNDIKQAIDSASYAQDMWKKITPNAQWDWIRWIRATNNPDTRKKHIVVALSKMKSGMRRPCCFNRSACTEPYVSHNYKLLEPSQIN